MKMVAASVMGDYSSILLLDEFATIIHASPEKQEPNRNSSDTYRQDDPDVVLVGSHHSADRWPVAFLCAM